MKQLALEQKYEKISELQEINNDLNDYVRQLEKPDYLLNKGKYVMEVQKKTKTIKIFMSRAKTTLWFADSFGLDIHSITLKEHKSGKYHSVEAETTAVASTGITGIDGLPENEKKKIEHVFFLFDKYCVGDPFYHELSMIFNSLPQSYVIKQRRFS